MFTESLLGEPSIELVATVPKGSVILTVDLYVNPLPGEQIQLPSSR